MTISHECEQENHNDDVEFIPVLENYQEGDVNVTLDSILAHLGHEVNQENRDKLAKRLAEMGVDPKTIPLVEIEEEDEEDE